MSNRGFSKAGLTQLHETMADHVRAGSAPGMVLALSRGDRLHIDAIGSTTVDGREPMQPHTIFRITSMTRPITAVATLMLIDDGRLTLDEPIDRLLPELSAPRVLRRIDGPVDDTVTAERPVTVEDLLTFRGGFGMILGPPSEYPILAAEEALELRCVGPPTPVTPHRLDEWLRRLGTLPLMCQPGTRWQYATGSQILGALIARASGQPADEFYRERIFGPLRMDDTGFCVPAANLHRLAPCYLQDHGTLEPFDDDNQWSRPRVFTDCGAGLVSTVGDYVAFGQMLRAGGTHDAERILATDSVRAMTTNRLTPGQREAAGPILDGRGWGFGVSIIDAPAGGAAPNGYGWSGGYGTEWINDPEEDLVAVLFTQVLSPTGRNVVAADFWSATYAALDPT